MEYWNGGKMEYWESKADVIKQDKATAKPDTANFILTLKKTSSMKQTQIYMRV
jgi:hypothetical protein